jgi:hypothetical protein
MTDRQLIRSIDPFAKVVPLRKGLPMGAKQFYISTTLFPFWGAHGETRKEAWAEAVKVVNKRMLERLEQ